MRPKLVIDLSGPDGNVYAVIGIVANHLKRAGLHKQAAELRRRALEQPNYEAVLRLCQHYADVTYIR